MRGVVVDANVFVSFFIERHAGQRAAAKVLLLKADESEIAAIVPQFVVFEVTYVLQSLYGFAGEQLATMIHDIISFPGVRMIDDCPWRRVMEVWPDPFSSLADAAIVAIAMTNRYDSVATFDQKLSKRMKHLGVAAYW